MLTRSFRFERIIRTAPTTESVRIPRINAPAIPRTHGHAFRRFVSGNGLPGGTYEPGGWYAVAFQSFSSVFRGLTTVVSSSTSTGVSGVPSSIQKLRLGSSYVRLQVEQRFISNGF